MGCIFKVVSLVVIIIIIVLIIGYVRGCIKIPSLG